MQRHMDRLRVRLNMYLVKEIPGLFSFTLRTKSRNSYVRDFMFGCVSDSAFTHIIFSCVLCVYYYQISPDREVHP